MAVRQCRHLLHKLVQIKPGGQPTLVRKGPDKKGKDDLMYITQTDSGTFSAPFKVNLLAKHFDP